MSIRLYNSMMGFVNDSDAGRSRHIQNALRMYHKHLKRKNVQEFLEECSEEDIIELKKVLKKKGEL